MIGPDDLLALVKPPRFSGTVRGPEDRLSMDVADMLWKATFDQHLRATWTKIPHEVGAVSKKGPEFNRAQARYAKQAAMGMIAGSADFVFTWPDGSGWIELKAAAGNGRRAGQLTEKQKLFETWCEGAGVNWAVCMSVDAVASTLRQWGAMR